MNDADESSQTRGHRSPWNLLPIGAVRPDGWIRAQLETDLAGFSGQLPELCAEAGGDIFVANRVQGGDWRHWWNGESEGKWIDGFTRIAHVLGADEALRRVDTYLTRLVDSQGDDGYLGIYDEAWRRSGGDRVGDLWTKSLILLALLAHYDATGDSEVLASVEAAARDTIDAFGSDGVDAFVGDIRQSQIHGHNLLIVEPMLWLHDITHDDSFAAFAELCYERFNVGDISWLEHDGKLERLSNPSVPMVSHGAHTAAQLRVPLLLHRATGDDRYRQAFETGFEKLQRYVSLSGACKSDECIGAEHAEGLPLPEAGYEYCTITEQAHSLHLAYSLTGNSVYADRAEWLVLNAAQASRAPDGRSIGYIGADNQYDASLESGPRWDYSPTHDDAAVCCNPSAVRLLAHHVSRMVVRTESGMAVGFFGPMTLTTDVGGVEVTVVMATNYPFDERISIDVTVATSIAFELRLRVPSWATSHSIESDVDVNHEIRDGHIVIDRTWDGATGFELEFATSVQLTQAIDGTFAVQRGPLLFALDIPTNSHVTRHYDVDGFADIEYHPQESARWSHALHANPENPMADLTVHVTDDAARDGTPWIHPPITVRTTMLDSTPIYDHVFAEPTREVTLVPIGATTLRRTTFPLVRRAAGPGHDALD